MTILKLMLKKHLLKNMVLKKQPKSKENITIPERQERNTDLKKKVLCLNQHE